jgi:hypothetical protein
MSLLTKAIAAYQTSKYEYEIQEDIDWVKARIENLTESKSVFYKHNLRGDLHQNNSFTLVRRWGFGRGNFIDPNPVTLDGRFYYVKDGLTRVKLEVRPNFIFILFSVILGVSGIVFFLKELVNETEEIRAVFFILTVPILYAVAHFSKNTHQKCFEDALNLTKQHLIKKGG